ncbi:MAG: carbon-nitrogen hydrolase family protein [Lewinellaceae bacterium]|nr:carbon-nitrogen hydrolase family protein [Saprospiraceae bacterium]MCB9338259.1 carbon-nitrogen hydrolase family protein [Lewinellaceae bacterium]
MRTPIRIAIVQESPVFLNLDLSLQKAEILIKEAADEGAQLIVFGECWLSGYPAWLDHCPEVALWNHEPTKQVFARMYQNSVNVPGKATQLLASLAKTFRMLIGIGINETAQTGPGNSTIYNAFLLFDETGELLIHHRKLMPTFTERIVYGQGDARGLKAVDTTIGRIGGLICWEHFMPLTRQAMHNEGELIHLALWPCVHEMHQVASRHYAFEGRCFVIAAGQLMKVKDIPPELEVPDALADEPNEWLLNGGSCVIAPDGFYDLKPQYGKDGIIYHNMDDLEHALRERMTLDVSGHYQRPDIFKLEVFRG